MKDEMYFPLTMTEVCNVPLKTSLLEFLQKQFGPETLIVCKQVITSMQQIVLLIETNNTVSGQINNVCYQITKSETDNDRCDINPLCFTD